MFTHASLLNIPHIQHGFFSRKNGHSQGQYASLNCGWGSGDNAEIVQKNYDYICKKMNVPYINTCKQIHSNIVVRVDSPWTVEHRPSADGMVTNTENIGLGVLTADCGSVLFADKKNGVIGAAHIGRKGALSKLFCNMIDEMGTLGANIEHIVAVLGPSISKDNYQVGQDIFHEMQTTYPEFLPHIYPHHTDNTSFLLDVAGIIAQQAQNMGVEFHNINMCTYANPDDFFSYRYNTHQKQSDYGRLLSVISLK